MIRLIACTFLFLGWSFYELSGGADFVAPERAVVTELSLTTYGSTGQNGIGNDKTLDTNSLVTRASASPAQAPVLTQRPAPAFLSVTDVPDQGALAAAALEAEEQAAALTIPASADIIDLRAVSGNRVNMRNGPGTNFSVVTKLVRGDQAVVLQSPGDGWVKIRTTETGRIGWMAERLLTKVAG